MRKPQPVARPRYIFLFIVLLVIVLFLVGGLISDSCASIGEFKACWKTTTQFVQSEFCPSEEPCNASPEDQQHNALVDLLLDACAKTRADIYGDTEFNKRIEDVTKEFTGYRISSQDLCEQPGTILAYRQYG